MTLGDFPEIMDRGIGWLLDDQWMRNHVGKTMENEPPMAGGFPKMGDPKSWMVFRSLE